MKKYNQGIDLPVGFGLALEEFQAMNYFISLPEKEQQHMVDHAETIQSKEEMLAYVQSIVKSGS
ncbi:hypothetical protein [Lacrimispora defluvii]|uniref:DUF4290 domain-containing protein n=1 Tax=Lacrimispora defluvii TaxID=2719233 RepID=A0ABX1VR29_9FIRM|nr:hypothetical protein [Lacrimispora defluvii]NNJ29357.1 DUF4290 domain-containing protein [Lacrimispora defluvii]